MKHLRFGWMRWRSCVSVILFLMSAAPHADARAAEIDPVVRVRGRVVDTDGKPVAGVKVTVPVMPSGRDRFERPVVASASAAADGSFTIEFRESDVWRFDSVRREQPNTRGRILICAV